MNIKIQFSIKLEHRSQFALNFILNISRKVDKVRVWSFNSSSIVLKIEADQNWKIQIAVKCGTFHRSLPNLISSIPIKIQRFCTKLEFN